MKHINVQIMGQHYLLGCPDGGEPRLREAVDRVDAAMCKIRDAGKVKARDRIAVLAALNLAFELGQCEADTAQLRLSAQNDSAAPPIDAQDPRFVQLLDRLDQMLVSDDHLL